MLCGNGRIQSIFTTNKLKKTATYSSAVKVKKIYYLPNAKNIYQIWPTKKTKHQNHSGKNTFL